MGHFTSFCVPVELGARPLHNMWGKATSAELGKLAKTWILASPGNQVRKWPVNRKKGQKCRRVPPCVVKTYAALPVLARLVGELRTADPSKCPGAMRKNASPGEQSEAPKRRWKPGQQQHPGAENQDSQHMLNQHRGSSPENGFSNHFLAIFLSLGVPFFSPIFFSAGGPISML